jgi:hypothetical protein
MSTQLKTYRGQSRLSPLLRELSGTHPQAAGRPERSTVQESKTPPVAAVPPCKTIVLEFLKEHHPALHQRLDMNRQLRRTVSAYAAYLKSKHVAWRDSLLPGGQWGNESQVSRQALGFALEDMHESFCNELSSGQTVPLSLDVARDFLLRHVSRI